MCQFKRGLKSENQMVTYLLERQAISEFAVSWKTRLLPETSASHYIRALVQQNINSMRLSIFKTNQN